MVARPGISRRLEGIRREARETFMRRELPDGVDNERSTEGWVKGKRERKKKRRDLPLQ